MTSLLSQGAPQKAPAPQAHRCTLQQKLDGGVYLAFEPTSGQAPFYSSSHFTLDLREGVSPAEAEGLAVHINALLSGVSSTIF